MVHRIAKNQTRLQGFTGGSDSKEFCLQCRRPRFDPCIGKTPWRREWQPIPVALPGEFHEQRSLVGYSLQVSKSQKQLSDQHFHFQDDTYFTKFYLFFCKSCYQHMKPISSCKQKKVKNRSDKSLIRFEITSQNWSERTVATTYYYATFTHTGRKGDPSQSFFLSKYTSETKSHRGKTPINNLMPPG